MRRVAVLTAAAACALALGCGSGDAPATDEAEAAASNAEPGTSMGEQSPPVRLRGRAPAAVGGIPSIVTLTALDGGAEVTPAQAGSSVPARGDDATIDQFGLAFSPRVLVVAADTPVRFTNSEGAITHNVHVRSIEGDSTVFNGDTGPTEGVDVELPGAGGYDVLCDMHPGMVAFIFVADAPWAVAAESDGSFEMRGIPAGEYRARAWSVETGFGPEERVVISDAPARLDLAGPR